MKLKVLFSTILMTTAFGSHANGCWNLDVSVKNETGHLCKLVKSNIAYGQLVAGQIPSEIANGQQTNSFTIQQTYTRGPKVSLEYQCENKHVEITSQQWLCTFLALPVSGYSQVSDNVKANLIPLTGSWWSSIEGKANWTLN